MKGLSTDLAGILRTTAAGAGDVTRIAADLHHLANLVT